MYQPRYEHLANEKAIRLRLFAGQQPLRFTDVIRYWHHDPSFVTFFIKQLSAIPYQAYFWEMPPLTIATLQHNFECVFIDSPALGQVKANMQPFSHFFSATLPIVDFDNLGGDARLIAPCPMNQWLDFAHLAKFSRTVDPALQRALWRHVSQVLSHRLNAEPLWVSTSGLGVYWLHIRLDSSPKYYTFSEYGDRFYLKGDDSND